MARATILLSTGGPPDLGLRAFAGDSKAAALNPAFESVTPVQVREAE